MDKPTFSGATVTNADSIANQGGTTNYITQGNTSAVNGGDVYNAITNTEQQYTGDNNRVIIKRKPSDVLTLKGGATISTENNIQTVANTDGSIGIKLAKDVNLGTDGSLTAGNTLVNNAGVTISNGTKGQPVSLTASGLNNGGNTITNVAPGVNGTDAANVDQLKTAQAAATTKVDGNQGVSIKPTTNQDGSTTYTVAAKTDGTTTTINGNNQIAAVTAPISSAGGVANTKGNINSLATAGDIINAVNSTGFTAKANGDAGQFIKSGDQVNFNNGSNIAITRNGSDFTIATTPNLTADSLSLNNGGPVINANGINMNNKTITNVAAGINSTDAVNVSQLTTLAAAAKTTVVNGKNTSVIGMTNPDNSSVYQVNVNTDDTTITTNNAGKLTAVTSPLTNAATGSVNLPIAPNALVTAGDVTSAINNSGFTLTANGANGSLVKPAATVNIKNNDGNIVISKTASDNTVNYDLAKNVRVDSININNSAVALSNEGLNNGGNRITNVAEGRAPTDAVNIGQLNSLAGSVNNALNDMGYRIGDVEDNANAGTSAAMATAALPQAYLPGKSMLAGGIATYNGQSAAAVGVSKLSDNGRWVIKANGTADTQGNFGGAVGAGFHW